MKNISKKFLPLLSASFCFFSNKNQELFKVLNTPKEFFVSAKVESSVDKKISDSSGGDNQLKNFLAKLNQTEIYLLVTNPTQTKQNKKILLLLHSEDRLNSEQNLINIRHKKFIFFSNKGGRYIRSDRYYFPEIIETEKVPGLSKIFRGGKSYYINNLGGYKSICPVFLDKNSAEEFLIGTSKEILNLVRDLPSENKKEIMKGFFNSKIITVGLGDFIHYYSSKPNENILEKVEFLFFPSLEEIKPKTNSITSSFKKHFIKTNKIKTFKFYQQKYYQLRNNS